jgi:hypothetical protein
MIASLKITVAILVSGRSARSWGPHHRRIMLPGLCSVVRNWRRAGPGTGSAGHGSRGRYGAREIWHQLRRGGGDIARRTVDRLMKIMGLQGVVRGPKVNTTNPDAARPCPDDKVNRALAAAMPNQPWVSDFAHVSSGQGMASFGPCPRTNGGQALSLPHRRLRPQVRRLARLHLDDHPSRSRSNQWRADRSPCPMP